MFEVKMGQIHSPMIKTSDFGGLPLEDLAEVCADKILGVADSAPPAIREQATATNNIAVQVERIAQMSEECSAAAGNSAETAQNLDRLATDMQGIVNTYKL